MASLSKMYAFNGCQNFRARHWSAEWWLYWRIGFNRDTKHAIRTGLGVLDRYVVDIYNVSCVAEVRIK